MSLSLLHAAQLPWLLIVLGPFLQLYSLILFLVSQPELEMIIQAFLSSPLDYCNSLITCLSKSSLDRLQMVQNPAVRLLTRSNRKTRITSILPSLHWLPIQLRIHFKVLVFTYRALHGQAPVYISDLLHPYITSRSLRSSEQSLLVVPHSQLNIQSAVSVNAFKKQLKTH